MIPSGKPHNEMLLGDADTQGVIGSKGAVLGVMARSGDLSPGRAP